MRPLGASSAGVTLLGDLSGLASGLLAGMAATSMRALHRYDSGWMKFLSFCVFATLSSGGVTLAAECGLTARGSLVEVESTVWGALVAAAEALDVDLLVTGTRGASGLKALLRSSVAERVLKHCHRPVFIVPAKCEKEPQVTL